MTLIVGLDVQPIDEVAVSIKQFGTRYTRKLFTADELKSCGETPGAVASALAVRFAAKEAMLKVLDARETVPAWRSIEVRDSDRGHYEIVLHDEAADLARRQGVDRVDVTFSFGGGFAAAAVLAHVSVRHGQVHL